MRAKLVLLAAAAALLSGCAGTSPTPQAEPSPSAGASQPTAAGVFYYFCDSANAYYPFVRQCAEGWKTLPHHPPGPTR